MKSQLIAATLLSVLIFSTAPAPALAQIHFDVTLEGPWILYVDKTLAPDKHPLLIAISAGGVSKENDTTYFHILTVTAGDGYQVTTPRVYCLTFGSVCGPAGESSAIDYDGYPQTIQPLGAAAKPGWDWISKSASPLYATVFILPMPKYFSTNGTWPMRFGSTFDASGASYDSDREVHSIGLQLHYENGPNYFDLQDCTPPNTFGSCPSATTIIGNTRLDDTGTLTIAMKSPDGGDACDQHVRRAYPKTIALLDADNSAHAVIDPAIGIDKSGQPVYDKADAHHTDYGCLKADLQGPGHPIAMHMQEQKPSWQDALDALLKFIRDSKNQDSHRDPKLDDPGVLLSAIQEQAESLDRSLPRFSKFRVLQALVGSSEARAVELLDKAKKSNQAGKSAKAKSTKSSNNQFTLPNLLPLEKSFLSADAPTKNGNDCKAAIVIAQ